MTEQRVNDQGVVMERQIIRGHLPDSVVKCLTREVLAMTFRMQWGLRASKSDAC